jgi:hypothetical protein
LDLKHRPASLSKTWIATGDRSASRARRLGCFRLPAGPRQPTHISSLFTRDDRNGPSADPCSAVNLAKIFAPCRRDEQRHEFKSAIRTISEKEAHAVSCARGKADTERRDQISHCVRARFARSYRHEIPIRHDICLCPNDLLRQTGDPVPTGAACSRLLRHHRT